MAQIRRDREESSERAAALRGWLGPLNAFRSRLCWHDHFCRRKRSAAGKQKAERVLNKHGSRRRRGRR